jgi:hypothetical protein
MEKYQKRHKECPGSGLPDFSWYIIPKRGKYIHQNGENLIKRGKYTKMGKIYQMTLILPNGH